MLELSIEGKSFYEVRQDARELLLTHASVVSMVSLGESFHGIVIPIDDAAGILASILTGVAQR